MTSFLESLLIVGMEVGTHVRWRAAISRNPDNDSLHLPFLWSFALILLACSVKNHHQITFLLFQQEIHYIHSSLSFSWVFSSCPSWSYQTISILIKGSI